MYPDPDRVVYILTDALPENKECICPVGRECMIVPTHEIE